MTTSTAKDTMAKSAVAHVSARGYRELFVPLVPGDITWGTGDRQEGRRASLPCLCLCPQESALSWEGHGGDSPVLTQELFRHNAAVPSGSMMAVLLEVQDKKASLAPAFFAPMSFHGSLEPCEEG